MLALALSLVSPVTAFVAGHAAHPSLAVRPTPAASSAKMLEPAMVSADIVEPMHTSLLLAKSAGDEVISEVILSLPTFITGGILAAFAIQYVKAQELADLDDLPAPAQLGAVAVGGAGFVVLAKAGVLGAVAGFLAKALLDGWNLFAKVVLPGALLKY